MTEPIYTLEDDLRLDRIEKDLVEIKETLTLVKETMLRADGAIANIAGQVMPTIEELSKSPLLKMLGMKSK